MNRTDRRALSRRGKRRTKPPAARMKRQLRGEHASVARNVHLMVATSSGEFRPSAIRRALCAQWPGHPEGTV